MITALVWGLGVAQAQDLPGALHAMPAPAAFVVGCHSVMAAGAWLGGDDLGRQELRELSAMLADPDSARAAGLDPDRPVWVAVAGEGETVLGRLPVADEAAFRAQVLPQLVDQRLPDTSAPDTWRDEEGAPFTVRFLGDEVELRGGHWGAPVAQGPVMLELLGRLDPDLAGCWAAVDVGALDTPQVDEIGAEAALMQSSSSGDRFQMNLIGVPLEEEVGGTIVGLKPARRTHGRSVDTPDLAVRINGDPIEAMSSAQALSLLLGRPLPPIVGSGGTLLETSGLAVQPGMELALGGLFGGEPTAVLVLPVAKPRSRRGLDKAIARGFADQGLTPAALGDTWSLDGVAGMDGWWLGTVRGALVLGTSSELVQAVLDDQGEPWIPPDSAELAARPGVWARADLSGMPLLGLPVVATAHIGSPAPGEVALVLDAPGLMDAVGQQLPGLVEDRAEGLGGDPAVPPGEDPVGTPPSTEALSVLMLIASREATAHAETGAFVGYEGGPREVEALDGAAVPWGGIPELGLAPMDAACRYEVRLDHEGWLATAWCDQDADGEPAVLLLRPGGTPITVSPPGVR